MRGKQVRRNRDGPPRDRHHHAETGAVCSIVTAPHLKILPITSGRLPICWASCSHSRIKPSTLQMQEHERTYAGTCV